MDDRYGYAGEAVIEKCEEKCCAEVSFNIRNPMTWSSATRYKPTSGGCKGDGISYIERKVWQNEVIDKISDQSVQSLLSSALPDARFVIPDTFLEDSGETRILKCNGKKDLPKINKGFTFTALFHDTRRDVDDEKHEHFCV